MVVVGFFFLGSVKVYYTFSLRKEDFTNYIEVNYFSIELFNPIFI